MSTPFVMPSLGESVEEGVITRWLKSAGDTVEAEEPLLEIATDKVDTEIPAPFAGVIRELLAEENSTVAVGAPLAVIDPAGDADSSTTDQTPTSQPSSKSPPSEPPPAQRVVENASSSLTSVPPAEPPTPQQPAQPLPPVAVDAARWSTHDTGSPVLASSSGAAAGQPEKMSRLRQTIAKRMVESLHVAAQLTTVVEADATALARLRTERKDEFFARTGTKLSFLPFFAKAAVEGLADYPMLNASISADNTHVTYHKQRHLGIAVDSPKGLMVPVIRDASKLSIEGLAKAIADLANRTRAAKIGADELNGGTFTLTNTGSRGALFDTPIINQPQTGILGTGAVVDRVVPQPDGFGGHSLAVRSMVYLSITYDHRIVDGADAARFLGAIKKRVEQADFAAEL